LVPLSTFFSQDAVFPSINAVFKLASRSNLTTGFFFLEGFPADEPVCLLAFFETL